MSSFVHLHMHSEYSLLDGTVRAAEIPALARGCGQNAAAITDSGVLYGAVEFWRACIEADVRPVIGCEVNAVRGNLSDRQSRSHVLVLLCESNEGYRNLCSLVSESFTEGFSIVPRVDYEMLRRYSSGLICLSGGHGGSIASALCAGDTELAREEALKLQSIYGKDNFFIELENHGEGDERQILPDLYALSKEIGAGVVAANNVKYAKREDAYAHSVLGCIKNGRRLSPSEPREGEYYFRTAGEMEKLFSGFPGAIENTVRIAERCDVTFEFNNYRIPEYPLPEGTDAGTELARQTFDGLDRLFASGRIPADGHSPEEYVSRAEYELSVIHGMGYDGYFLIVADYVGFAKKNGISVGPGRGSGCGSLVAFAAGITDIDPIGYELYFERFLNPERVSMPDIDVDFDHARRGEVVSYLTSKYGRDCVAQIITFGTLAARAAVRDVGRVLGTDPALTDRVSALIPRETDVTLASALGEKALKQIYESDSDVRRLIDTAAMIEGLPRNVSVHAAGVVITSGPVKDYVPLALSGDTVITQYDMTTVEKLGLLKFDLLALRNLSVIDEACARIRETEPDFDVEKIDLCDREAFEMLCSGDTSGIFQLDKEGMRRVIMRIRPRTIGDLMTAIALYRPGPMDSIPKYIEGRRNPSSVVYPHPLLKPILEPTFGCLIYQEQVMSVFRVLAGYSPGRADLIRRAMSKKKASALEAEREGFIAGAAERGMTAEAAGKLFDDMTSFAGYAFNKSHAAAYAVITFRTAWLKAHHPDCFFAALLNSVKGNAEKVAEYIAEAEKYGAVTLKPDINASGSDFEAHDGKILFGLSAIKAVGPGTAEAVVNGRKDGKYRSLQDFVSRLDSRALPGRTAEALVKSGSLDSLGVKRTAMLCMLETLLSGNRRDMDGEMDIFSAALSDGPEEMKVPDVAEFSPEELAKSEEEYNGIAFTGRKPRRPSEAKKAGAAAAPSVQPRTPARVRPDVRPVQAGKIYIRVPSETSEEYSRCDNLCAIFDGPVPVFWYFADSGKYAGRKGGIAPTVYLLGELEKIAGEGSVVPR